MFPIFWPQLILIFQVTAKRTNIPGMKQYRPRRPNPYMGFRGRTPYAPPFAYSPYGYGCVLLSPYFFNVFYLCCNCRLTALFYWLQKGSKVQNANAIQPLLLNIHICKDGSIWLMDGWMDIMALLFIMLFSPMDDDRASYMRGFSDHLY